MRQYTTFYFNGRNIGQSQVLLAEREAGRGKKQKGPKSVGQVSNLETGT